MLGGLNSVALCGCSTIAQQSALSLQKRFAENITATRLCLQSILDFNIVK